MRKLFNTEIGCLGVWDSPSLAFIKSDADYQKNFVTGSDIANLINRGFGTFWSTGGDGKFIIDVRINPEQDLSDDEQNMIEMKSLNHKLIVTGNYITIGSPEVAGGLEPKSIASGYISKFENIESGTYKVDVYFVFDSEAIEGIKPENEDLSGYVVIIKKSSEDTQFEHCSDIPSLG